MKIIDRYIATQLVLMTGIALLALLVIFSFLSLIDQLEDAGRGNYDAVSVIKYVFLIMPRIAYESISVAAVIGSVSVLGIMAYNSELLVIRTSGGVSTPRLSYSLLKGALIIVLFMVLLGEFIAPYCEQEAQHLRSVAISEQISLKSRNGFWSRDGSSYINIRKLLPGDRLEDIYIYEFDKRKLRIATYAKRASFRDGKWILEDINQSILDDDRITGKTYELAAWDSLLKPRMINLVTVRPQYLTVLGLFNYIKYLNENDQNSMEYELAFWSKIINPVTVIIMVLIAVPLVRNFSRTVSVSQHIFIGSTIGIVFYILNQLSGQIGIVYSINPFLCAMLPTLLAGSVVLYLIYKKN